jgi:hypothetical protein
VRRLSVLVAALALAGCSGGGTPGATPAASAQGQIVFSQPSYSCASVAGSGTSGPKLSWSANLTDKAGGLALTIVYARKQANGAERSVIQGDMPVSNPDFSQFSNDIGLSSFCADPFGPGDYVMRIVRPSDSKVLAEGSFTIAP